MTDTNTKGNPVLNFLWTNRNPMQKTANLGVAAGLILGGAGVPAGVLGASFFALPIFYNVKTEFKGGKKIGMCLAAGAMSIFTLALGAAIGSSITGKEISDTSSISTPKVETPSTPTTVKTPVFTPPAASSWNDETHKRNLETGIKENFALQLTGAQQAVASVSCKATGTKFIWNCDIRKLGDSSPISYRIEVAEDGSTWAGQPI